MAQLDPNIKARAENYFAHPSLAAQKHYEALRAYFLEKDDVKSIAERYGYTVFSLYSLIRDFKTDFPYFLIKEKEYNL